MKNTFKDIQVVELHSPRNIEWDNYINNSKFSTFYHLSDYLNIISKETNQKLLKLAAMDRTGAICGVLPIIYTKGIPLSQNVLISKRLSSLPRTPYGGPVCNNSEIFQLMINHLIENFATTDTIIQIKSTDLVDTTLNQLQIIRWRKEYIKRIPTYPDKILFYDKHSEREILRAVRRAKESGLKFKISTSKNELHKWYRLYLENAREHLIPARKFSFFEDLWETFYNKKMLTLNLVYNDSLSNDFPIAGTLNFQYKGIIYGGFKGKSKKYWNKFAEDFLHYKELNYFQQMGYLELNMGEVPVNNPGLERYKRKWGMEIKQIYHYYYPETIEINAQFVPGENKITKYFWNKLPLSLIRFIGARVNNFL